MQVLQKVQSILSKPSGTVIVLLLSIGARIIQLVYFYNIHFDPSYQIIATENLLTGHGISITKVFANNIAATIYQPLSMWPPGYSLLFAVFYAIFQHNYIAAGITLDILSAILFIFSCRSILKALGSQIHFINLFTLCSSFYIYFFYLISCSDAIAISFFLLAISYCIKILVSDDAVIKKSVFIGIILSICAWLKYFFIPVVFCIPLFFLMKGYFIKKRKLQLAGIITFCILVTAIGTLLVYTKSISNSVAYISQPERGFFPEHLLDSFPFVPEAFAQSSTFASFFNSYTVETSIHHIFQWLQLIFVFIIVFWAGKKIKQYFINDNNIIADFFYLSVLLSLSIVLTLSTLSLFVAKETYMPGKLWTYVQEARYYGLITVLIHLLFSLFISKIFWFKKNPIIITILSVLFVLVIFEISRGLFFTSKRIVKMNKEEYGWQWENRFQQFADSIIQSGKSGCSNIVVTGPVHYLNNRISIFSNAAVLDNENVLNEKNMLKANSKTLLLVILPKNKVADFSPFQSNFEEQFAGEFEQFNFYKVYVGN